MDKLFSMIKNLKKENGSQVSAAVLAPLRILQNILILIKIIWGYIINTMCRIVY
jgi:hypothetical protein